MQQTSSGLTRFVATSQIPYSPFSLKHKSYINNALNARMAVAEGSVRAGKTIDNCLIGAILIDNSRDKIHLASGSTQANAKTNIGDCNGFGLEHLFRGRCKWVKYKGHETLRVMTPRGEKFIIFVGGKNADSYKKILGTSFGVWIATEINEHYISDNPQEDFITIASNRQIASKDPHTLWDLNPSNPKHKIYSKYVDRYRKNGLIGGFVYEHFTIFDNLSVDKERRLAICSEYDPNSVTFKRNILGQRVVAEGVIFPLLANNRKKFVIDISEVKLYRLRRFFIGVDFGGNGSGHAFCCCGIDYVYKNVVVLASEWHDASGINVTQLCEKFVSFVKLVQRTFSIDYFEGYCDSAEQTIINELVTKVRYSMLPLKLYNAMKCEIKDRIRGTEFLLCKGAIHFVDKYANSTIDALSTCIYNPKEGHLDERLDDGTTNIDSVDAYEYCIERSLKNLIRSLEVR